MQRDSTVIQAAILLIIIAILWVAILKKQQPVNDLPTTTITRQTTTTTTYSGSDASTGINVFGTGTPKGTTTTTTTTTSTSWTVTKSPPLVDNPNSPAAQLVKNYFSALASQDFVTACGLLSPAKCAPTRPSAVASFSTEYLKLVNGYEYLAVRDYGFTSPSGKDIVCVKYSYTYKDDARPAQISEVYSYYTSEVNGKLAITDRVCEKKYKDGGGTRPCPIQATQNFCLGKIK
jgi:hypothetical protein